ncbi:recombination protein recR [Metamycoplasma hyosynoviae]|uniref:DNA replication and repair protein RecR n=1 Tax=Metamycoplasma hyosynoviae TaxID=29559 RepID=A0A063YGF5_9BACT|nr:toprim domain-containing protein [Metamycoplasma hyosynoviae]KDE41873.1 recombination protein recR [Metamycoplasma hyosynoviae]KDE42553.1 recombination protein recR [Metamycoplasma hyosynoviae]KDE43781.1 recombination protein recR [Metamycoplasma hyosynoviae]KDE44382.1 recombination protein recR [Metamycoplasma hyosynoviae]KDE45292.1 recombination protein recR [Metamycoplasma hyosynoviae]
MDNEFYNSLFLKLSKIKSLSKKQVKAILLYFINSDETEITEINKLISKLNETIKKCVQCNLMQENEICKICSDHSRKNKLIVVNTDSEIEKFEALEIFNGKYYIFETLFRQPTKIKEENNDSFFDDIEKLTNLVNPRTEVILALNPTLEGQISMQYIKKYLLQKYKELNIFQLSIGLPINGNVEYADPITLKQALINKQKL